MAKLTDTKVLAMSAMLLALATLMGFLKVPVNQFIELRFAYLPIASAGFLFGPGVGAVVGALSDIMGYLVKPTGPYFPGFTLSSAIAGVIYGFWLYGKPASFKRVLGALITHAVIISFLLNPLWLCLLYGRGFVAVVTARGVKTLIMLPIEAGMLYTVLKQTERAAGRR